MLLDTSGLFACFDPTDLYHDRAQAYFDAESPMLINDYVLAEFIPLCQVRGQSRVKTLAFVESILNCPFIDKVWTTQLHYIEALTLLKERLDKTYSLCDAVSFVSMRENKIVEALTTDKHFEQEGFVRLLT